MVGDGIGGFVSKALNENMLIILSLIFFGLIIKYTIENSDMLREKFEALIDKFGGK